MIQIKDKKYNYQMYSVIIGMIFFYIVTFRGMSMLLLGAFFNLVDIPLFGVPLCLVIYFAFLGPMQGQLKYQRKANKNKWMEAFLKKSPERPEPFYLPFQKVYKLELDFDNDDSLKNKLQSDDYTFYYQEYLKHQMSKKMVSPEEDPRYVEFIKKLEELKKKTSDSENGFVNSEKYLKALQELSRNNRIDTRLAIKQKQFFPKIDELKKDKNIASLLDKLNLYVVFLGFEQQYENGDKFDQLFILLPGEFGELLKTGSGTGNYNGWWVETQECLCSWIYWRDMSENVPLWFLDHSENMSEKTFEHVKKISSEAGLYIELKALETWNTDLESKPRKLELQNLYYRQKSNTFEEAFSDYIQDNADKERKYGHFMTSREVMKERERTDKYRRRYYLFGTILASTVIIFIILIILVAIAF